MVFQTSADVSADGDFDAFALRADAHVKVPTSHNQEVVQIFIFALVMYGLIGAMWITYLVLRRRLPQSMNSMLYLASLMMTWASMSIGMHVLNKSVVHSLKAPALVAAVQMAMAVLVIGLVTYGQWAKCSAKALGRWMIVPIFFAAMLCSATYTYQYMSLSLITVVRNLTPFIVLPTEYFCMPPEKQPHISLKVIGTLVITLVGTVVYAGGLKGLSGIGIAFAVGNMILAVADRVIQRYLLTGPCQEIPSSICTVLNNGVGMIPSLVLAAATMQLSNLGKHEYNVAWTNPMTLILLIFSGIVGIGICYVSFEVQREISASSFFVMQNVSKVAVVIVGILVFGDPIRSAASVIGLLLSLGGCTLYGYVQMQAAKKPEAQPLVSDEKKKFPAP